MFFFFNEPATTDSYTYVDTLSLHDALPISDARRTGARVELVAQTDARSLFQPRPSAQRGAGRRRGCPEPVRQAPRRNEPYRRRTLRGAAPQPRCRCRRSEEHTSELQSLMRISYAVFCLKKNHTNN